MSQRANDALSMLNRRPRHTLAYAIAALVVALSLLPALDGTNLAHADPVSGSVLHGETLKPVAGAKVSIVGTDLVAIADEAGGYRFEDVPVGTVTVRVEADGYETSEEQIKVEVGGLTDAVLVVLPPGAASEIIELSGTGPPVPVPPGKTDLRREELTRIPGTRGDALTSIKSLPGVANADAGGSGPGLLVIRGSAPEDSKVTIDGIEIPLLYHFFGLQSIVPSEFIDTIDYLPGGFGADEGRATGGVIGIATRADHADETGGFAEMSFINLAGFVQGPLSKKHDLQFAAGFRRSAIDLLLPVVIPDDATVSFTTAPQYYDGQLRIDWRPDERNRVTFLGLGSFDLLTLLNDTLNPNEPLLLGKWENETSFLRAIVSWHHKTGVFDNRLVAAPGLTGFRFEIGDERYLRFERRSFEVRDDAVWRPSPLLSVRFGADMQLFEQHATIRFPLAPQEGSGGPANFSTAPLVELMDVFPNHRVSGYVSADFTPTANTIITPGVRVDYYDRFSSTTLGPRLSLQQKFGRDWTLRAALGAYSRPPQQGESLQVSLLPELATQYVIGGNYRFGEGLTASVSGFYTDRRRLIVQDPVQAASDPDNAYVNRGFGRSYGMEALIRAKRDNFFGWIAYTLSRSDRIDGPMDTRRLFDYDQTHNVIVVGSYTYGGWEFGGRWQYSTGSPITPIDRSVYLADFNVYIPVYGTINSDRLDAAHQLDLRIDRKWRFRHWALSMYLDVTNVYAHPKTLGFRYNFDFSQREAIEELPIVPAIGVRGSF